MNLHNGGCCVKLTMPIVRCAYDGLDTRALALWSSRLGLEEEFCIAVVFVPDLWRDLLMWMWCGGFSLSSVVVVRHALVFNRPQYPQLPLLLVSRSQRTRLRLRCLLYALHSRQLPPRLRACCVCCLCLSALRRGVWRANMTSRYRRDHEALCGRDLLESQRLRAPRLRCVRAYGMA